MVKTFSIKSNFNNITPLTKKIDLLLSKNGISKEICNSITIALLESLNNVIKHSYNNNQTEIIKLKLQINTNCISIKIIDYGIARKNVNKPKIEFNCSEIETLPESGMGLFIIENLMDQTTYISESGLNILTLIKKI